MITRRTFLSLTASSLAVPILARAWQNSSKVALYANVGAELLDYDVDVANALLIKRGSITLPAGVQYAWPHASRRCLYVVSSDGSTRHYVTALHIDPRTGELSRHGESVQLSARPIHITTDIPSEYVLVAFNIPSGVRVFRINQDLTIGNEIPQPGVIDGGIFAHQIRVTPDNRHSILVTRGNAATSTKPEDPGALKMFDYNRGILSNEASIAPDGGKGFGPRHLDFHPTRPWVYVCLETQNRMYMYRLENGRLAADSAYRKDTLAEPYNMRPRQLAGAIHVHPNGRFVYVANRADSTIEFNDKKVFAGGENNIAVYSINQTTGEPTPIQHIDTGKVYPRTFHIDPSGRFMVVQHTLPVNFRDGNDVRLVPAGLTVFRIGNDGKLTYERLYDVDVGKDTMFWMGMVRL
jgi:6-phosphogluconolactonase (cycloisomerase 2 family)